MHWNDVLAANSLLACYAANLVHNETKQVKPQKRH